MASRLVLSLRHFDLQDRRHARNSTRISWVAASNLSQTRNTYREHGTNQFGVESAYSSRTIILEEGRDNQATFVESV